MLTSLLHLYREILVDKSNGNVIGVTYIQNGNVDDVITLHTSSVILATGNDVTVT